jgi:hypothetical protein
MKIIIAFSILFLESVCFARAQTELRTDRLMIIVSDKGQIIRMADPVTHIDYLAGDIGAPLMKIRTGKDWEEPGRAIYNPRSAKITLIYLNSGIKADIAVMVSNDHLAFKLVRVNRENVVNAVCWGPYPLVISKTIGEVIGVVRDTSFAIGIQALNVKTIGGMLKNEGGTDDSRGSAAVAQPYGSSLQAYSLDRSHPRKLTVWGNQYPEMPVKAIPGETVTGSAIALFGCREEKVLETIGKIELSHGLPHPLINGNWLKESPETGRAYMISDFTERNIDDFLEFTQKAGLTSLYHEGPFQSWGHFVLDSVSFPNGRAGMKLCADKASRKGIRIGAHTLSTFINTNDPYVTPVPDPRLAATGSSYLPEDTGATDTIIAVADRRYFANLKPSTLRAVRIGKEIIQFREVTPDQPYRLLGCKRGAFGTKASGHKKGEIADMLMDYPYQTLFPDFNLQQEIAGNMARFFNETGVSQMDFDGHEGCMSSGEGEYAMQAFAEKVFRETNHTLVNGTSRSGHYYWHICHYWNWGEPWYGGFRESQGDYRLENQPFLERNYMPNMLGWFLLSSTTSPEDIAWMMARAAGYNAGFALVARYNSLKSNPQTDRLLELINMWQEASRTGIFSQDQLARLKDPSNDFRLEKGNKTWLLYPFRKQKYDQTGKVINAGEKVESEWEFENPDSIQPFRFNLTFRDDSMKTTDLRITLDGENLVHFRGELTPGTSVVYDGKSVKLYNQNGKFLLHAEPEPAIPELSKGKHRIIIRFVGLSPGSYDNKCIISTISPPEQINR